MEIRDPYDMQLCATDSWWDELTGFSQGPSPGMAIDVFGPRQLFAWPSEQGAEPKHSASITLGVDDVRRLRDHLTAMLAKLDNRCESCGALAGEMQQCRECGPILGHDDGVSLPEPIE